MTDQEVAATVCIAAIAILALLIGLLLRWLLDGLERSYGVAPASEKPMSPIQLFIAGGGDMSTCPPGVADLLMRAEEGWNRHSPASEEEL